MNMYIIQHLIKPSRSIKHFVLHWYVIGALRHSLQDRLGKGASGKNRDEIFLKLRTSTGNSFFLIVQSLVASLSTHQIAHP